VDLEAIESVLEMGPHGVLGDREILADLVVRPAHGGQGKDLGLSIGQPGSSTHGSIARRSTAWSSQPLELATDEIQDGEIVIVEVAPSRIEPQASEIAVR